MLPGLLEIFMAFFRAGAMGFGGGAGLASTIHRETVVKRQWITDGQFSDMLAVSNMLPGPFAIETAAAIGWEKRGLPGALTAVTGLVVPFGIFSVVFVLSAATYADSPEGMRWFNKATVGLFIYVAAVTSGLSARLLRSASKERSWKPIALAAAAIFLLVDTNIWFGFRLPFRINNAFIILVMVMLVMLHETPWTRRVRILCILPSVLFLWALSRCWPTPWQEVQPWVTGASAAMMAVIALAAMRATPSAELPSGERHHPHTLVFWKKLIRGQLRLWTVFAGIFAVLGTVFAPLRAWMFIKFAWNTVFASLITFGGGPAYIPIVIAMQSDAGAPVFLYTEQEMLQVIAVTNPIPSPIMTKLSAVSGYDIVSDLIGNVFPVNGIAMLDHPGLLPWLTPWLGAVLMMAVMALPAITIMLFAWPAIDRIKASPSLKNTSLWIKPLLAAVFASVTLMFLEIGWHRLTGAVPEGLAMDALPAAGHLAVMTLLFVFLTSKRFVSDFWIMALAILWGLLLF